MPSRASAPRSSLFSVVKRQNEGFALGFVTTRIVEAAIIFIGVVSLLSLVTLQQTWAQRPERQMLRRSPPRARRSSRPTTGRSRSDRASCRASTPCCSAPCCTDRASCRVPSPRWDSSAAPILISATVLTMLRRRRAVLRAGRARGAPDRRVGVLARPLPDLQGLQGLCADHGGGRCPVGQPRRDRQPAHPTDDRRARRLVRHDRRPRADPRRALHACSFASPGCCTVRSIDSAGAASASRGRRPAAGSG